MEPFRFTAHDTGPAPIPTQHHRSTPLTTRQRFSSTTSSLVYIITCRACTLSYIVETGRWLGTGSVIIGAMLKESLPAHRKPLQSIAPVLFTQQMT